MMGVLLSMHMCLLFISMHMHMLLDVCAFLCKPCKRV